MTTSRSEEDAINEYLGLQMQQQDNLNEYKKNQIDYKQYKSKQQEYHFKMHAIFCELTGVKEPEYEYQ